MISIYGFSRFTLFFVVFFFASSSILKADETTIITTKDCASGATGLHLFDSHGRNISDRWITLTDWEGQIANPAIEFSIIPPIDLQLPVTVTISSTAARLYFCLPSVAGPLGPSKTIMFTDHIDKSFFLSIFPDRDPADEFYILQIIATGSNGETRSINVPVNVDDQDTEWTSHFLVNTDFTQDESGFFSNMQARSVVHQAANDWSYFFDDMNLIPVNKATESTYIWSWPLAWTSPPPNGAWVANSYDYCGFLIYASGVDTPETRSGGQPSPCCFHHTKSETTQLRRSGTVNIDIKGNYNLLGWLISDNDNDWWLSGNFANQANDLYSIALHEMGHAIGFNPIFPDFETQKDSSFQSPALIDYYGEPFNASVFDHFPNVIDPASRIGAFGNEYHSLMLHRRWLITKIDLLILESIGYTLRQTSAFRNLSVNDTEPESAYLSNYFDWTMNASGGVRDYDWTVLSGELPVGLSLCRFTGTISGIPEEVGSNTFLIRIRDSLGDYIESEITIYVKEFCQGDVNGDGAIDLGDLNLVLSNFGQQTFAGDANGDGVVDLSDLNIVLSSFGNQCP